MAERVQSVAQETPSSLWTQTIAVYLELAKARLSTLVAVSAGAGCALAAAGRLEAVGLVGSILGTGLAAFGANILNQCLEQERDGRMERTRGRPLPSGRIELGQAVRWGLASTAAGLGLLLATAGTLAAALGLVAALVYVLVYTPLKARTPLATLAGAVCGAIPPLIGWTAGGRGLEVGAWVLFAVLFLWQIPHSLALAWLYREDYARGGFRLLPSIDPTGKLTTRLSLAGTLALLPATAAATAIGMTGTFHLVGCSVLWLALALPAWRLMREPTPATAHRLFVASLFYLPLLLGLMLVDVRL